MPVAHEKRFCPPGFGLPGRNARGFTIIELVCTLVILGILTAQAVPRFAQVADNAHQAVVWHTAGALRTAVLQAYFGCVIKSHAGQDNLPGFGAGNVDFNANCFPASTNGNNGNVNANRCLQIWNAVLAFAPTISTPANGSTDYRAQGSGTTCTYTYRKDLDDLRRFVYSAATGEIQIVSNP